MSRKSELIKISKSSLSELKLLCSKCIYKQINGLIQEAETTFLTNNPDINLIIKPFCKFIKTNIKSAVMISLDYFYNLFTQASDELYKKT